MKKIFCKKSIFFTIDGIFASILLASSLLLVFSYYIESGDTNNAMNYISEDIISCLSSIRVSELNDSYVSYLISNGNITNPNSTIIEQIGEFYVSNKTILASNFTALITESLINPKYGFSLLVNGDSIYATADHSSATDIISYRRMVSGFEKEKPIRGSTSKVFLEGIKEKTFSSFIYFGGFIGQGNVSAFMEDIPSNATITSMYLQLSAGGPFELYFNGIRCNTTFYPNNEEMSADAWDVSECNASLIPGAKNNVSLVFVSEIGNAYIGGGYFKVDYRTDLMRQEQTAGIIYHYLEDVDGIVNTYSSFYIPGSLNSVQAFIHYFANNSVNSSNTFYLTIGNSTIMLLTNLTGENNITLFDYNFSSKLNYSLMGGKTIPMRLGFENVSFGYIYEGNADVAIVTDVSGSMNCRMAYPGPSSLCTGGYPQNPGTINSCTYIANLSNNNNDTQRLAIVKCKDINFTQEILNIVGNKVGLVSYSTATETSKTVYPTTNLTLLNNTINSYATDWYTCICCGINTAKGILNTTITRTFLINQSSIWNYSNGSVNFVPPLDSLGNHWYDFVYQNETQWKNGTAILGATNGFPVAPSVVTEIGSNGNGSFAYANLWERFDDTPGAPNDFTSGRLNASQLNTYGIAGANDGWDRDPRNGAGPFDFDDDIDYNNISGAMLSLDNNYGGSGNVCSGYDCSGAYGIKVTITNSLYNMLASNGTAMLSLKYRWDGNGNNLEDCDEVWVKANWTSPTTGSHSLGTNHDSSHTNGDNDLEIWSGDNPSSDASLTSFIQEITQWIEGPGDYYFELGGKLRSERCGPWWNLENNNRANEYGTWTFDDIQLQFSNFSDNYYFRKHFRINDLSKISKGVLNILSDDRAVVYLNGNLIDTDVELSHDGKYWNRHGVNIPSNLFLLGDNVIAAKLTNFEKSAKFDIELLAVNDSRDKAMMVMTDGVANENCAEQGTTGDLDNDGVSNTDSDDAIQAACDAREDYGITVYAVGYSNESHEPTLQGISDCGGGKYVKSSNTTEIEEFYQDIASTIVSASRHAQTITSQGSLANSRIYGDSYFLLNYTSAEDDQFGEISVVVQEDGFDNCSFNVTIPNDIRISDAKLTSYSSEHWTDELIVNGNSIYNLSSFNEEYTTLGDPFVLNIPSSALNVGTVNSFYIRTGDTYENFTGCSKNNSLIYTALLRSSVSYSDVLELAEGCTWLIEFDNRNNITVAVPPGYIGAKECYYTNAVVSYNQNDTYDDAMYRLLDQLDLDNDHRIFVDLENQNFVIGALSVGKIPYPWGPAITEVRVWK
ncbi:MAG: vWA domain-containing protein [archaeon]